MSETSRVPVRARTYWIPDEDVEGIAESTAHLRIDLPWLESDAPRPTLTDTDLDVSEAIQDADEAMKPTVSPADDFSTLDWEGLEDPDQGDADPPTVDDDDDEFPDLPVVAPRAGLTDVAS